MQVSCRVAHAREHTHGDTGQKIPPNGSQMLDQSHGHVACANGRLIHIARYMNAGRSGGRVGSHSVGAGGVTRRSSTANPPT